MWREGCRGRLVRRGVEREALRREKKGYGGRGVEERVLRGR